VDADNRSFPSPELFEPHRLGTLADQSFLPEFMPDLGTPVKEIKSP
jgi:hypothetical protein